MKYVLVGSLFDFAPTDKEIRTWSAHRMYASNSIHPIMKNFITWVHEEDTIINGINVYDKDQIVSKKYHLLEWLENKGFVFCFLFDQVFLEKQKFVLLNFMTQISENGHTLSKWTAAYFRKNGIIYPALFFSSLTDVVIFRLYFPENKEKS